jgi:hypothetical protein
MMAAESMRVRLLGARGQFRELHDDDCAWCEAAYRSLARRPHLAVGDAVHLENDKGQRRTVTCVRLDPMMLSCQPYVFFRDYDDDDAEDDDE